MRSRYIPTLALRVKMNTIVDSCQYILKELLPASVLSDVNCFVLYDNHPADQRQLDIIICSKCEIREYFQREVISSIQIFNATDIRIVRNSKCELYYLISCRNEVSIVSSNQGNMVLYKKFSHVLSFTMQDDGCAGKETLKITQEHDALPVILDDNFDIIEQNFTLTTKREPEMLSIHRKLNNKLTEAMYITKCNEQTLDERVKIRQLASFSLYQKACDQVDSAFNLSLKKVTGALKVETRDPIVKLCNKKLLVILKMCNRNAESLENVNILLHGSSLPLIDYTTVILKETSQIPYFKKIDSQIEPNSEVIVVAVIDLDELKYNVTSRIDFDIVLSYKKNDKIYLLPFKSVSISATNTMERNFDVLACNEDYKAIMLAVIATSQKVVLKLRHVRSPNETNINLAETFLNYLHMRPIPDCENVFLHNESPFHLLHGVMVVYNAMVQNHTINIEVYTRQPSQVLALIHYMYEKVPHRIIVTTTKFQLRSIVNEYNLNDIQEETDVRFDYQAYAESIIKQIEIIQKYLLECSQNMTANDQTENKIDLMAQGMNKYYKFIEELMKILHKDTKQINQINEIEHVVPMEE